MAGLKKIGVPVTVDGTLAVSGFSTLTGGVTLGAAAVVTAASNQVMGTAGGVQLNAPTGSSVIQSINGVAQATLNATGLTLAASLVLAGSGGVGMVLKQATAGGAVTASVLTSTDLPPTVGGAGTLTSITTAVATGTTPYSVACDPTGRYVYVVNQGANTVSMYAIGSTGALTSITTALATGTNPYCVACDPTGRYVYGTNSSANTVSQFSIGSTGALTTITTAVGASTNPYSIACDPTGKYVYATNSGAATVSMFAIGSTGALTTITSAIATGTSPYSVACDPTGRYVYIGNYGANTVSMYAIGSTGALTTITTALATGTGPNSVACDPTGRYVYVGNQTSNNVSMYSIGSTGALTSITTAVATGSSSYGAACDPTGRYMYVVSTTSNTVSMFSIANQNAAQVRPMAMVISDRITPATRANCLQVGAGATNYTVVATSGTPILIPGLMVSVTGFLLISCSNGDQAVIGLGIGATVGYCALTWNSGATSLAVTTPAATKWAIDFSVGWRINNQIGSTLSYVCTLIGGP